MAPFPFLTRCATWERRMKENSPRMRQKRALERKQGSRSPSPRILIVCEGKKTEPQYFTEIRIAKRLSDVDIAITNCPSGTAPRQIVEYLEKLLREEKHYEEAYAVFDRDAHESYYDALTKTRSLDGKIKNDEGKRISVNAIFSNPCFELWLLSHFDKRVERHIERDEAFSLVKQCIPGYEKGSKGVFSATRGKLDIAYTHADRMRKLCQERGTENPQTMVDCLVRRIITIKDQP